MTHHGRSAVPAMYVGLGLTVVATIVPFIDRDGANGLAGHVRAGYPAYSETRIDAAVSTYLVYLSVIGVFGIACWLGSLRAVRTGRPWARGLATAIFAVATLVAVTGLLIKDTSGDTGLPPSVGWLGVLPCLAGLVAVVSLWRGT